MATEWTKAKELDEKTQCLVFGFVKESQKLLSDSSSYWNISDLIIFIILSFYQIKDEWDEENSHKAYKIEDDILVKVDEENAWVKNRSAFMTQIVSKGTFRWKFKIVHIVEPGQWNDFIIGIINANRNLKYVSTGFYCDSNGHGYDAGKGRLWNPSYDVTTYGIACKGNDIIEMELNMNELYLKYIINGKDYGKAFDVEPGKYKAAVYLYKTGDKLRIV